MTGMSCVQRRWNARPKEDCKLKKVKHKHFKHQKPDYIYPDYIGSQNFSRMTQNLKVASVLLQWAQYFICSPPEHVTALKKSLTFLSVKLSAS